MSMRVLFEFTLSLNYRKMSQMYTVYSSVLRFITEFIEKLLL